MIKDMLRSPVIALLSIFLALQAGCSSQEHGQTEGTGEARSHPEVNRADRTSSVPPNTLTETEKADGWELLFDGESTDGWRQVYGEAFPSGGWVVEDGELVVLESNGRQGGGAGSIVTEEQYSDFELQLEFKLTEGANSGIKYFVVENPDFFEGDPAGRGIGLEYQVLDDRNHPDAQNGVNGNRTVASLYDLIPAAKDKTVHPVGEWNRVRLLSDGSHVEHWLNGQKVLEYERGGDAYRALVDKSKYAGYDHFGMEDAGHILLQDHGNRVAFRNIKIRRLERTGQPGTGNE